MLELCGNARCPIKHACARATYSEEIDPFTRGIKVKFFHPVKDMRGVVTCDYKLDLASSFAKKRSV